MTGNDFLNNLEGLDADLIEAANEAPQKRKFPTVLKHCAAILLMALLGSIIVISISGKKASDNTEKPTIASGENTTIASGENTTIAPVIYANATYLTLDINPSLQLTIKDGQIVDYLAINDDGEKILNNIDIIGKSVNDALPILVAELLSQGYLAKTDNSPVMLLSAHGGDNAQQLLEDAISITQDSLVTQDVESFIVAQQIENPEELKVLAEKYGVSVGKMQYVLNILRQENNLTVEEASAYTIIELFGMDIETRLIEPPYKVGDYDEYGEKVLFVGTVESYVGYVPWDQLSSDYKKQLEEMYTPEALKILSQPRVWTTVPNVLGLTVDEALELLYSRNIAPRFSYVDSPNARIAGYTDGMVFYQDIPQGMRWNSDACIQILILISERSEEQKQLDNLDANWGLNIDVKNISNTGLTMLFNMTTGSPNGGLTRSDWYVIERKDGDQWIALETLDKNHLWKSDGYVLNDNTSTELPIDWSELYGILPSGEYRIGKLITERFYSGGYRTNVLYTEFKITQ